jgi:hypothetical protein
MAALLLVKKEAEEKYATLLTRKYKRPAVMKRESGTGTLSYKRSQKQLEKTKASKGKLFSSSPI